METTVQSTNKEKLAQAIDLLREVNSSVGLVIIDYPETLPSFDELISEMTLIDVK